MNVLIVEDEALVADALSETLKESGYHATYVTRLTDLRAYLETHGLPDVVISDGDLGHGDTVMDVRAELARYEGHEEVLFILHTGSASTAELRKVYDRHYAGEPVWIKPQLNVAGHLKALLANGTTTSSLKGEVRP